VTRAVASTDVVVERADILSGEARSLIEALNAELSSRYPEDGATHFRLDPDEVAPGHGAFLVARRTGRPVGCGAVRRIEAGIGEVKRMYVSPEARSGGVGRAVLTALENETRALGLVRLVLETGIRQPEAIALYERAGFSRIPAFGEYVHSPLSVCMAKDLAPRPFYGEFAWAYDYVVARWRPSARAWLRPWPAAGSTRGRRSSMPAAAPEAMPSSWRGAGSSSPASIAHPPSWRRPRPARGRRVAACA
jgi:putative acetyltransferase